MTLTKKIKRVFLFFTIIFFLFLANLAFAGFGISPPYFRNDNLTRGSYFEQKIFLSRGDPIEDAKIEIKIDVPEAGEWIKIDKGTSFIFPKGEKVLPITISVNVPEKANYKRYEGNIRIIVSPAKSEPGQVAIALGAQIKVDLNVFEKKIINFKVGRVQILDLEEGYKWWFFYFPGKITMTMEIENLGNIEAEPSKILLDIYNFSKSELLETTESLEIKGKVLPFKVGEISAFFPTKLPKGYYWVKYKILKENELISEGELPMTIRPKGSLPGYKGYAGFSGLLPRDKIIVISILIGAVFLLVIILILIFKLKKRKKR